MSCSIGRPLNTPTSVLAFLIFLVGLVIASFFLPMVLFSSSVAGLFPGMPPRCKMIGWTACECILSAFRGSGRIHFLLSMRVKNSERRGADWSVLREPMMISFERARVNETFILRQSFTRSPSWYFKIQLPKQLWENNEYLVSIIWPNHRNNDAFLIPSLTTICSEDLDLFMILQKVRQKLWFIGDTAK